MKLPKFLTGTFLNSNNKYKTIPNWIKGNFTNDVNFRWFSINKDSPALNIDCIESIKEIDNSVNCEGDEK